MYFPTILAILVGATAVLATDDQVAVPWYISNLQIYNTRHGSGGTWQFNIVDTPTTGPQSFNTSCHFFNDASYYFAIDGAPVDAPCTNPNVTFSLVPDGNMFQFNVMHLWGNCGTPDYPTPCNDNGTWLFSHDDVSGQEFDERNNFGQAGGFSREGLNMYPNRAVASTKCEFC